MSVKQVTPLLIAERRCTNLEAGGEEHLCDEEKELLALWYDRKQLRAQLAAERAMTEQLAANGAELLKKLQLERAKVAELVAALEEIANPRGAFNPDRLTHAQNTIANLVDTARAALDRAKEASQ